MFIRGTYTGRVILENIQVLATGLNGPARTSGTWVTWVIRYIGSSSSTAYKSVVIIASIINYYIAVVVTHQQLLRNCRGTGIVNIIVIYIYIHIIIVIIINRRGTSDHIIN